MSGNSRHEIVLQIHSVLGYSIIAVLAWKTALALHSLKRPSRGRPRQVAVLVSVLLLTTLSIGVVWSIGGFWTVEGITGNESSHLCRCGDTAIHCVARRGLTPPVSASATVLRGARSCGSDQYLLLGPPHGRSARTSSGRYRLRERIDVSQVLTNVDHTKATSSPTTSWLNDKPSEIDTDIWRLKVVDVDGKSTSLSLLDLEEGLVGARFSELEATLDCTGGWFSHQIWSGVYLRDVLEATGMNTEARSCIVHSVTGYTRRYAIIGVRRNHAGDTSRR